MTMILRDATEFPSWLTTREQDVIRWALECGIVAPLSHSDFARHAHVVIWRVVRRLHDRGSAVDYLTVRAELDRCGELEAADAVYLHELARDAVHPSDAALRTAAAEIQKASRARRARAILGKYANPGTWDVNTDHTAEIIAQLQELSDSGATLPPFETLRERLARPVPPIRERIHNWQPVDTRVLLAAQFKSGKTTLMGNLVRSLVDGDRWLDRDPVDPVDSLVLIDCEMSERQGDAWLRAQRIRHDDRVHIRYLRGSLSTFNILEPTTRALWAAHLRQYRPQYLVLDCARPLLDAFGLDEHREAGQFLVAFDALLADVGIRDALIVHHMGHTGERARGDSRFRDWPDVEWRLMRQDEDPASARFITAYGRDVDVAESRLEYDALTRRLTVADGSRKDARSSAALAAVLEVLTTAGEPLSGRAIKGRLEGVQPRDLVDAALRIGVAIDALVAVAGPKNSRLYTPVSVCPGASGQCPADSQSECPGAYISPDTRTLNDADHTSVSEPDTQVL